MLPSSSEVPPTAEVRACLARFVSRSGGKRYFLGPVLLLSTRDGGTVGVACIDGDLADRMRRPLEDRSIDAPSAAASPEDFVAIARLARV